MPTKEAIVDSIIPKQVEKPIPVRVVSTRTAKPNINQRPTGSETPAAASATPEESVRLSPQLSALARKEQAYRQREQALKEREKALEDKLSKAERYSQLETRLQSKDYSAAEELGMTYEEYTKYLIDKQSDEDPTSLKFKTMEEEIQSLKKAQEEKATQEYVDTVAEYRDALTSFSETNPEFKIVSKFKDVDEKGKEYTGIDVALQYILDEWEESQIEVSVEDACKRTKELFEEKSKYWASLIDEPPQVEEKVTLPPPRVGQRTLTQTLQPTGIEKAPAKSFQHMSDEERYVEARRRVLERRKLMEGR